MRKVIYTLLLFILSNTVKGQTTDDHWYGYPPDRQVSAVTGGLTGMMFYSVARSNMENEPKWKSMLVSTGGAILTSSIMALMPNQTPVERRQNFTASMVSGISVTLIFSLGI